MSGYLLYTEAEHFLSHIFYYDSAMVASKKKPAGGAKRPGPSSKSTNASASKAAYVNPFDKFANARKKHEVLNRRAKGEDRNVGRARAKVRCDEYF
jgi:hypothetical protein